ncbi:unnamed protein product [Schistosoma turkestanicum]|nr:unnamed protein product [Schistosoma turkestanicum]
MSLIEKFNTLRLIIRQNGGIKASFLTLFRTDELKWGNLVGTDKFGNKYYENNKYFLGEFRPLIYFREKPLGYIFESVWLGLRRFSGPTGMAPLVTLHDR